MKLCTSNIAWEPEQDSEALELLGKLGVAHLELAPTRWWRDLSKVESDEIFQIQGSWNRCGLTAVCLQAVLFGRSELSIFDEDSREACLSYLQAVIQLASRMGVSAIVFGAPGNRIRGFRSVERALAEVIPFFRLIGRTAMECGVRFCFEPNPVQYGGDFGCTVDESLDLVERVASPGFWLNLDSGAIALNREDPLRVVERARGRIGHVHISEPWLRGFSRPTGPHSELAKALEKVGYDGFVSIEMRVPQEGLAGVGEAVAFVRSIYSC